MINFFSTAFEPTFKVMKPSFDTTFWKKQLKDTFLIALGGIPTGMLTCTSCLDSVHDTLVSIAISASIWVLLWKGNGWVNYLVGQKYDWLKEPAKRLIWSVVAHVIYTSLAIFLWHTFLRKVMDIQLGDLFYTMLISIVMTLIISLILHSRSFLSSWRQSAIDNERMQKETISARYETLKNQVNPHFLFNSLNVLTHLVYEDADQSARFIKKLSEVYRYVLDSKDRELTPFKDEMKFVEAYLFLQKIRHEDSLEVEVKTIENDQQQVVPIAIQMLVENAIKHNVISENQPLKIGIEQVNGRVIVKNNLQKKNILKEESSGTGLKNIISRYEFLTDRAVEVHQSDSTFEVSLPLLETPKT